MRAQEAPQPGGCRMPKEARKIKQQYRAASRAAGPTHPHFAWSRLNRHHVEVWGITPGHNRPALPAAAPAKAWSQGTPGSTARGKEAEVSGFWILVRGSPFAVCSSAFRPSPVAAPAKAWSPDAKMASLPVSKSLPAMLRAAMQAGPLLPVSQSPRLKVSSPPAQPPPSQCKPSAPTRPPTRPRFFRTAIAQKLRASIRTPFRGRVRGRSWGGRVPSSLA